MNRVETVRLHPPYPAQLIAWLERFNAAANWLSGVAFRERLWHWLPLQRRAYREVRERFQLPGAATVVVIRKVAYAYRNKQRRQHQATFRRRGAIPVYQHRYKRDGTVLVYGLRMRFAARPQAGLSSRHQAVLCYRRGKFMLHQVVAVDVSAPALVQEYLGCDLGTVNMLTDSEAEAYSGQTVEEKRRIYVHRRARLQKPGYRSSSWIQPTRVAPARSVVMWTSGTAARNRNSGVVGAGTLGRPTSSRHGTSVPGRMAMRRWSRPKGQRQVPTLRLGDNRLLRCTPEGHPKEARVTAIGRP